MTDTAKLFFSRTLRYEAIPTWRPDVSHGHVRMFVATAGQNVTTWSSIPPRFFHRGSPKIYFFFCVFVSKTFTV